ncbi:hypothetical protein pEaSNUABM37_00256 [Erwinia phage pEa_SNUABM_37]|nr:hypothetical protein pEaSNUABM37_00256 [Erwinia phage pEa_SNUABM_37]QXO10724.1 hypothetical protein pEaSNUABM48_00256 [Erwinia phage pEa_SNUABM_48]
MYNEEMLRRGEWLEINNKLNLKPFRSLLYVITNQYDLSCLTTCLKDITDPSLYDLIDWSTASTDENNYCLLHFRSAPGASAYHILYAPILERVQPGDHYAAVMCRLQAMINEVCFEVVNTAGYNPMVGCITFSQLASKAFFDLTVRVGVMVNATMTMATPHQRQLMQSMNAQQWSYLACLSEVELYTAVRTMADNLNNNIVYHNQNGWQSTTYFS